MSLKQDLPLLNALAVFEAAARTSSFTHAAKELHIAQSAVSRHVSNLESYFELQLFDRQGKRVELTSHGKRLADAVSIGFGHISVVLRELRREKQSRLITIGCSYDFAHLWLMPRFGLLRGEMDGREIRLLASHNYADFDAESVDLSVRFGQRTEWHDCVCIKLFGEVAFPICSPDFLKQHPQLLGGDPACLRATSLLDTDQRGLHWQHWFAAAGVPPPPPQGPVFSSYLGALYEALAGRGVALGWQHMLGDFLERGLLVRLTDGSIDSDSAYFAIHRAPAHSIVSKLAIRLAAFVHQPAEQLPIIGPVKAPG